MAELAARHPSPIAARAVLHLTATLAISLALAPAHTASAQTTTPLIAATDTLPEAPGVPAPQSSSTSTSNSPDTTNPGDQHLPPSGAPATNSAPETAGSPRQTTRILGVLPNFRAVSAGETLPPQTAHDKFTTGFEDSFDYSAFIFAGAQAGVAQATNSYPAFRQGAAGYARYFWHTFADSANENLLVESFLPIVTHEDSRYYTLGKGGFFKRSAYAVSRAAITRSDHGGDTANISEIVGAGAAAGISNLYYPGQYYNWTKTGQRWLTNIVLDDALLYVKEFWPDINQRLLHGQN